MMAYCDSCRNKHIMIDLGTGNNNKMCVFRLATRFIWCLPCAAARSCSNWAMDSKQEVSEPPHDPCAYGDEGLWDS